MMIREGRFMVLHLALVGVLVVVSAQSFAGEASLRAFLREMPLRIFLSAKDTDSTVSLLKQFAHLTVPTDNELAEAAVRCCAADADTNLVRDTIIRLVQYGRSSPNPTPAEGLAAVLCREWKDSLLRSLETQSSSADGRRWVQTTTDSIHLRLAALRANSWSLYAFRWGYLIRIVKMVSREAPKAKGTWDPSLDRVVNLAERIKRGDDANVDVFQCFLEGEVLERNPFALLSLVAHMQQSPAYLYYASGIPVGNWGGAAITQPVMGDTYTSDELLTSATKQICYGSFGEKMQLTVSESIVKFPSDTTLHYLFPLFLYSRRPSMTAILFEVVNSPPNRLSVWGDWRVDHILFSWLYSCIGNNVEQRCSSDPDISQMADPKTLQVLFVREQMNEGIGITDYFVEEVWKQRKSH